MSHFTPEADPHGADDVSALVESARCDPAAFAELYDRFVQPVFRYIRSRVGGAPEAEDLTAQTFLAALESLPRYRHRGRFSAWLFTIARSKVVDHLRRRAPEWLDESHAADGPDPLAQAARSEESARLSALIRALDSEEQELIRLRFVADLPFAAMASVLGKNEAAVKKSLYRLLDRLQKQLDGSHE